MITLETLDSMVGEILEVRQNITIIPNTVSTVITGEFKKYIKEKAQDVVFSVDDTIFFTRDQVVNVVQSSIDSSVITLEALNLV